MYKMLTLGGLREGAQLLVRFSEATRELNYFKIQVHTNSMQAGLSVYRQDD